MLAAEILQLVAQSYDLAVADLRRPGHPSKRLSDAKKRAIEELRAKGLSLPVIGRLMGGMHHTSVMYQLRRPVDGRRALAPSQSQRIATLEAEVRELRQMLENLLRPEVK